MALLIVNTLLDSGDDGTFGGDLTAETNDGAGLSLREALALSNANSDLDEVSFAPELLGGTLMLEQGELTISNPVDIDGDLNNDGAPDVTIDAQGNSRVLLISSGSSSIDGLTVTGGYHYSSGGGIYFTDFSGRDLGISNSVITGNSSSFDGGGFYGASNGNVTLTNTTISNNYSSDGGGIYKKGGLLTLDGSLVTGNSGSFGAGLYGYGSFVSIADSLITGNTASAHGGGIYADDGLNDATLTITNSTVSGNSAGLDGGGIYIDGGSFLTDVTIDGNSAGSNGGGINFDGGSSVLTNVTISRNSADTHGGGVWATLTEIRLNNVTISGNSADGNGGGIYTRFDDAFLYNSTISGNSATGSGDGIYNRASSFNTDVQLNNSIVLGNGTVNIFNNNAFATTTNNNSINGDDGGAPTPGQVFSAVDGTTGGGVLANKSGPVQTIALLSDASNPAIDASTVSGTDTDARGVAARDILGVGNEGSNFRDLGAFEIGPEDASLVVTTTDDVVDAFDNQTSLREAIAFANDVSAGDLSDGDADNDGNSNDTITFDPGLNGGTIFLTQGAQLTIDSDITIVGDIDTDGAGDITIDANSGAGLDDATSRVLMISSGTATLDGLTITGGKAVGGGYAGSGGGIYIDTDAAAVLTNSTVGENYASAFGGGIFNYIGAITLTNSTVSGNYAKSLGGGLLNYKGLASLTDATVSSNGAGLDGGGLHNFIGNMTLTNTTLSGNSAHFDGGGLYNYGTATLTNSTISGNSAGSDGGGIFNDNADLMLIDTTISENSANEGGGIGNSFGTLTLTNSAIDGNSAIRDGGGIKTNEGTATLTNTSVSGNSAGKEGGGIYSDSPAMLTNSTISGNSAGGDGGGIYIDGYTTTLNDSTIGGNSAANDGGGIFNSLGGIINLTNSTLSGNSATYFGGGLYNEESATLTNTTISGNSAGSSGGGIYNDDTLTLSNSIVLGNSAPADAEIHDSDGTLTNTGNLSLIGGNPAEVFAAIDGTTGGGELADNGGPVQTIALRNNAANPALDGGDDGVAPATDARGQARFDQPDIANNSTNISDLGAFELQAPLATPPDAVNDSASLDEDSGSIAISVLDNDSDPEGDAFSVTGSTLPANGALTDNGSGNFSYTPEADFNGADSFTYTITNGAGGTDSATVTITVNPVNDAPVAAGDAAILDEDSSFTLDVLANDSDVDGDVLSVAIITGPANGVAVAGLDGIGYTPDADFNGTDMVVYSVSDGNGSTDTATATFTVNAVNDDPVAADDAVSATIDEARDYGAATLLDNDSDADGDVLTIIAAGNGVNGSAVLNGTTITFTPDPGFAGAASFTYTISDGNGGSDSATVTVTVADNQPPIADAARSVTTLTNTALVFDIAASDPDGDALSFSASDPANGTVSLDGNRVTYTPDAGFMGSEVVTITIDDGNGGTATQDVTVTTQNLPLANQFVMFTADGFTGGAGGSGAINGTDAFQQISVIDVPGSIALDPSFNKGGDVLQLTGDASAWNITRSGSSAVFSDGDTFVTVPVGTAGLAVQFDDGVRELIFDGSDFTIGGQAFAAGTLSPVTAAPDGTVLPPGADPAAKAVLFIAADAQIAASGVVDIFGAAGNELARLISGNLTLDASFNNGGDTIAFDEAASDYLASQVGSSVRLTGSDTTALIPVGTSGATLAFGDGSDMRTILFDTGIPAITIGTQEIGLDPVQLMAA